MFICGEPGIGKSTLARVAARHAQALDFDVAWGFAWEQGGAPAYWPWTQVLQHVADTRGLKPAERHRLQEIMARDDAEAAPSLQPEEGRFRLLDTVRSTLDRLCRSQPIVVVLEDLHAADSDSLLLLQHVVRHVVTAPLMIVGSFREAEARAAAGTEPLWRTLRDATVLRPRRLTVAEIARLTDGDTSAATTLFETSEGNPLFVTELQALLQQPDAMQHGLPATIEQLVAEQLARLPADVRDLLHDAAILGREFDAMSLGTLTDLSVTDLQARTDAAVGAGLLLSAEDGRFRFVHMLHRDAIYNSLDETRLRRQHLRYAGTLRTRIEAGEDERWAELAQHLDAAGIAYRADAAHAWREAARAASARLAFDDAVAALRHALQTARDLPQGDPTELFDLLLDCARANLLAGDVGTGQRFCADAWDMACAAGDAAMMADAALCWGSVFVVAKVDRRLIGALRDSLAALPEDDAARRSRVQARLAAALQPAIDPAEPMQMARDAISMARAGGDAGALYDVLRSASSALMDFAPPGERADLNRETMEMAAARGDVPARFRSSLRLMIDAAELADRPLFDAAVDRCRQIADRVDLPHYHWRAASAEAMRATIDGQFADAAEFLETAANFAADVDDGEALLTLPIQRLTLCVDWDSPSAPQFDDVDAQLQHAYRSGLRDAEFFIAPFVAVAASASLRDAALRLVGDEELVQRTFAGGDRATVARLGELAVIAGDDELAVRARDALVGFADFGSTLGLMGSSWCGPVARPLAAISRGLGDMAGAHTYLEQALAVAARMRSRPYVARAHADLAAFLDDNGDATAAERHRLQAATLFDALGLRRGQDAANQTATAASAADGNRFALRRVGEVWEIRFDGSSTQLRDSRGLDILSRLVARPGAELHVLDLVDGGRVDAEDSPALDDEARRQYKARLADLRDQLDDAETMGDSARADAARAEIEFLGRELSRAFGLGGRARRSGSAAERARVNVRRRLVDAMQRIDAQLPGAGAYLESCVKTGLYCSYHPV